MQPVAQDGAPTDRRIGPARWLVYACRSAYTAEVAEILWRAGAEIAVFVDNLPDPCPSSLARVVGPSGLTASERLLPTVIPLITPGHRFAVAAEALAAGIASFPALADPTAVVARTARLGEGTMVNAQAVIGAEARLGRFVQVNRSASIGHDVEIDDYASLGPGCVIAGHVALARGVFVGAGAVLVPKLRIGANAVVNAGAVVIRDVPAGAVVAGNPARIVREAAIGYGGVAVPAAPPAAEPP